ncbi:ABC transporter substrate-binding protein [Brachybacterium alimentarium]|uniref:ABC transporter substrate-binding protein n=1 Tax=Brachybacterium alimentarium TaxID=47845 RepID=UPI003FD4491F
MHALTRRSFARTSLLSLGALTAATACSSADGSDPSAASDGGDGSAGSWPRTVTLGNSEITLDAAPQRIVAVSTETGDLALELVGPERMAGLVEGAQDPSSANQSELAQQVEDTVVGAPSPDPEQILSLEPDLVLLTERHDGEESVGASLTASGVPCAAFASSDFESPQSVAGVIAALGGLLGAEDAAAQVTAAMQQQIDEVEAAVEAAQDAPRTLGLFVRGPSTMMFADSSSTSTLIELAGGTSIATESGWHSAPAADPEVLIDAAPDVILVQDFHGGGLGPFSALLESPALADVPAIAENRVHLIDALTTSGSAGARLGEGLRQIASLLHPDLVDQEQ